MRTDAGRGKPASFRETQDDLFGAPQIAPKGFRYQADFLTPGEETDLVRGLDALPFEPFNFQGYLAKRQVVRFGLRYDYDLRAVVEADPMPPFLEALRSKVGAFAGLPAEAFVQALINEYRPGAGISWHRDKPQFEEVAGVSLLAPCKFRLRRETGAGWERQSMILAPRSAYLLSGPARHIWEHSIPPVDAHRYSITFRTMAK